MSSKVMQSREVTTVIDEDGNANTTIKETSHKIESSEPDYIKLYTKMWCEFNSIPTTWRELFLELAQRMTYASSISSEGGQIVYTGGTAGKEIRLRLGWKDAQFFRGLAALCDCRAIRKLGRGEYQINPSYAGKGEWKYNPRKERGGVEDLVAKFSFKDGTCDTNIIWADDGSDSPINKMYREGLGVEGRDNAILKEQTVTQNPSNDYQTSFDELDEQEIRDGDGTLPF